MHQGGAGEFYAVAVQGTGGPENPGRLRGAGPIWTPLIPASFSGKRVEEFGRKTLLQRQGQPAEVAPSCLFLAAEADSSFITGQVLHVNGGQGMVG